ncbi:MAG TPA: NPCBM/NEW2 domain-containing protein [Bacteroidales bacterium]|nr:NPCBM/NEW2 domain-containing protein [Bacteroidales bacterium]
MKRLFYLMPMLFILASCKTNPESSVAGSDFHSWAPTPPMGWNSWDCYGPTVTEPEVKNNADYMAKHLKKYGWEYIVVDIRWYVENDKSGGYNEEDPVFSLDEYGRFTPAVNKFPSAKDGKGFKPLADYVHEQGLKFGIHMMRGIPVVAVEKNTPVLGSEASAKDIYSPEGQCVWLHDMYTVIAEKNGAQEYYNSLFQLYAEWGIDFVKFDDLSGRTSEIEMIRKAIDKCGRPIVISISPGGDKPESADFLKNNVNMWRTSNDFWDNWPQLKNQFTILKQWAGLGTTGSYPDGDMLPLGKIGLRAERGEPRWSGFTKDEQYTLMTLFAIFRSPLMFGGDLPSNDDFTLSLLTNSDVIYVNQHSNNGREVLRENDIITWIADDPKTGDKFLALFNASDKQPVVESKALWKSRQITSAETDQSVPVDVDIAGAKKLYLVVTSEDISGFSSHNCNWINPEIVVNGKTVKLTEMKWVKGASGRGMPLLNQTRNGGILKINDQEYTNGINVNAVSIVEFDLPEGVTRFKALAGLQSGVASGTDAVRQNNGKFLIFTEDPSGPEPGNTADITVYLGTIGLTGEYTITDLWTGENLGKFTGSFTKTIARHGAGLFRVH